MNTPPDDLALWPDAQVVQVQGDTALDFLQGYLTCNSDRLSASELTPMAMCNVKGRTIVSGWAYLSEGVVNLIVHQSLATTTVDFLTPFARFHRCKLDIDQNNRVYVTSNPQASFTVFDQYLTVSSNVAESQDAEFSKTRVEQFELNLVQHNFVFLSALSSAAHLPQTLGFAEVGALDFDKGCYLGQEIVARAEFRGALKRGLTQFTWPSSEATPQIGQPYHSQESKIDHVLTVVAGHGLGVHKRT